MNARLKPELFAPCFPAYQISFEDIEVGEQIKFTLQCGEYEYISMRCQVHAESMKQSHNVNNTPDPQNDHEIYLDGFKVDTKTLVQVLSQSNMDVQVGSVFILTEDQASKLNERIEEEVELRFEREIELQAEWSAEDMAEDIYG